MQRTRKYFIFLENMLRNLNLGMRAKLIILFVAIKVLPLVLLALLAWQQIVTLGNDMQAHTDNITVKATEELIETGKVAVDDAVLALDNRATEEIERSTTDMAEKLADFLYARDDDIRFIATLTPNARVYENFLKTQQGKLVKQGTWELAEDEKSWVPTQKPAAMPDITPASEQNKTRFKYRKPDNFDYHFKPLYLEITFIDLQGQEKIKLTSSDIMSSELKNVSDKSNTFCKAETYFAQLQKLAVGEIYVSELIGEYVGSPLIGIYTPENAKKLGIAYEPEKAAFAGEENPNGKRFKGIIRFATPVQDEGKIIGYVTLALDHDHILNMINHTLPTERRYGELASAIEGNYFFLWGHKGRNLVQPRHHSIAGYNAQTGEPEVSWFTQEVYDTFTASGKSYF